MVVSVEFSCYVVGCMWNEGFVFYGWLFYFSKFYEVFDMFIIFVKGKFSLIFQIYYYVGVMMCMWVGMCYMLVFIWIFVFFNFFIYVMMVSFILKYDRK